MFKLKSIYIEAIGGIEKLSLSFNPQMNVICGLNGIGKTTILECIAQSFTYNPSSYIRKKADHDRGFWEITNLDNSIYRLEKTNFHPSDDMYFRGGNFNAAREFAKEIITIKTYRTFDYIQLTSISRDPRNVDHEQLSIQGIDATDAKNWFINRYLWEKHEDSISSSQRHNLEVAKTIFHKLDPRIVFSKVKGDTYDILVKQNNTSEIYFEYLSSGYKSVIFILLGIIKEIEQRFSDLNLKVEEFNGIVLIDELDLHLHPQWQANLLYVLKDLFPYAQFIVTTHSAHVIQAAEPNEIISLGYNEEGEVIVRETASTLFGFQGWTVEEILTDVMGLEETRSSLFLENIANFESAIDEEDYIKAKSAFDLLNDMLHPNNHMRKLLSIQLSALGSGSE
ncbi:AAA family ATPase [Paenibacillus dokdonensis]|uniref:AAA family ATPase n=1 Tax=Paenibacillus dokdonensis TaxID=2567944 RepID=UPI0010A92D6C|nr:AAA family ATPase [Paenibacillus dokdonensis]